jgi:hypothetical protein
MATVIYTNGKLFYGGHDLSGDVNDLSLDYGSEMLDVTTMGDDTRINKGGLTTVSASASGFWNGGANNADAALFDLVGDDVEPFTVFGNGITEGESVGCYAFKGLVSAYNIGNTVGDMMTFDMEVQGRGTD